MNTSFFASFVALCIFCFLNVSAVPLTTRHTPPVSPRPINGTKPPRWVVYTDESAYGIPGSKDLEGYNTLILSFFLVSGAADQADAWARLSNSKRQSLKADYKANNITLLVSAFGSTESPTTNKKDPVKLAKTMAAWVKKYGLDGIDVDYEDFKAVAKGTAVPWLETFTRTLRDNLPDDQFIITHAPVAPWFAPGQPYAHLNVSVGHLINWYNVQFYSQGTEYTSCKTLIHESGGDFPGTSVLEIVKSGIPQEKVVLGKPSDPAAVGDPDFGGGGGTSDAGGGTQVSGGGTQVAGGGTKVAGGAKPPKGRRAAKKDPHINGFLETKTLAQCLREAKDAGWNAGVMAWEYPQAGKDWIQTVRSVAWPYKKGAIDEEEDDSNDIIY